jgi:Icc protein
MHKIKYFFISILLLYCCKSIAQKSNSENDFSFVFATDIHVDTTKTSQQGFQKAIDTINQLDPDFVITGGDLVMDALDAKYIEAVNLFKIYKNMSSSIQVPVYNTIGNHDFFGVYDTSGTAINNPEYGTKMYENNIGEQYKYFEYKGCHFFLLNSVKIALDEDYKYIGLIDSFQIEWIKSILQRIDTLAPIIISTHIPFLTVWTEVNYNALQPNFKGIVVNNSTEVLKLFENHNLKLVLQGHLHYLENIKVFGIDFITGGSVCGNWWTGPHMQTEEGFLKIDVKDNEFTWKYIDLEWSPTLN